MSRHVDKSLYVSVVCVNAHGYQNIYGVNFMKREMVTLDANEAVAYVAYRLNEVIAIYPITPSSAMGEFADSWSAASVPNLWGTVPLVVEMQAEGGAAGAVHGALTTGSLTTTSLLHKACVDDTQYAKIAGELTPAVFSRFSSFPGGAGAVDLWRPFGPLMQPAPQALRCCPPVRFRKPRIWL